MHNRTYILKSLIFSILFLSFTKFDNFLIYMFQFIKSLFESISSVKILLKILKDYTFLFSVILIDFLCTWTF